MDRAPDRIPVVAALLGVFLDPSAPVAESPDLLVESSQARLVWAFPHVVLDHLLDGVAGRAGVRAAEVARHLLVILDCAFGLISGREIVGEAIDRPGRQWMLAVVLVLGHLRPRLHRLVLVPALPMAQADVVKRRRRILHRVREVVQNLVVFLDGLVALVEELETAPLAHQRVGDHRRAGKLQNERIVLRRRPLVIPRGENLVRLIQNVCLEGVEPLELVAGELHLAPGRQRPEGNRCQKTSPSHAAPFVPQWPCPGNTQPRASPASRAWEKTVGIASQRQGTAAWVSP